MANLKEYLVTVEVSTTYQVQCFAECKKDLKLYEDNKHLLSDVTQTRLKQLEQPRIFADSNIEEIDRYITIVDVEDVDTWSKKLDREACEGMGADEV